MTDFQAIADRVAIEALRGEYSDALMMHDYDRLASLFTEDGAIRMPHVPAEAVGPEEIREAVERLQSLWEYFVQTMHSGVIELDGDTAAGRTYLSELMHGHEGSNLNYGIYHDRYQRTAEGWKFAERVYELQYVDTTPLTGSAPQTENRPAGVAR